MKTIPQVDLIKVTLLLLYTSLLVNLLTGCSTAGFPRQSYDEKKQIKQLEEELNKTDSIKAYYAPGSTEETKRAARDRLIEGRQGLIDLNYNQFVAKFSVTKQSLDASTEIIELGLNLATTATGGAGTKTVLAAIASGVGGSKLAIDKNFFFEKTVGVLITTMNAQRKQALAPILIGTTNNTQVYPLSRALADIDAYYFAGTFVGALQAIQADAGAKDKAAEFTIKGIRDQGFVAKATQDRLSNVLDKIDTLTRDQAIGLEKNPPVPDAATDKMVKLRDPGDSRFSTDDNKNSGGKVSKQMLKMRVVVSGKRSENELAAWEAAVRSVQ